MRTGGLVIGDNFNQLIANNFTSYAVILDKLYLLYIPTLLHRQWVHSISVWLWLYSKCFMKVIIFIVISRTKIR